MTKALLPSCYFPPISYFKTFIDFEQVEIEIFENYIKQTYRNRCEILSANGVLDLVIPIQHTGERIMKDLTISYAEDWQTLHIKSMKSAYQRSPYFEYYEDKFMSLFQKKTKYLIDWNFETLALCQDLLQWDFEYRKSSKYEKNFEGKDFRQDFSPKKPQPLSLQKYNQVFDDRFEFQSNLSIFDLLCNLGPEAQSYLKN